MDFGLTEKYNLENNCILLRTLEVPDKEWLINFVITEPESWKFNIHGGDGKENFESYFEFPKQ